MKHKVGDKVRIKSWDWYNKNRNSLGRIKGFMPEMSGYLGKEAIIEKCYNLSYELNIDHHFWNWDDEMFDETYNGNKMENKKVKINLPKNCEVDEVKASVENGFIVVEYIPKKKFTPKNGDIIYFMDKSGLSWIGIYKYINNSPSRLPLWDYCSIDIKSKTLTEYPTWILKEDIKEIRLATEQEKKMLFDALENKNLIWNAEENKLEKIRWRAKRDRSYYFINSVGKVAKDYDDFSDIDFGRYEAGNYFQTEEEAQEYADKIKELLKNR